MKKVGIVGGLGPVSTVDYYNGIIRGIREQTTGDDFPQIVIDSVNLTEMLGYSGADRWDLLADRLAASVNNLAAAGADFAVLASNTPHIVFDAIQAGAKLPLISIVEETCGTAQKSGVKKAVILGTLFTMRSGLYTKAFERCGIETVVPDDLKKNEIQSIIFPNLENGLVLPEEKARLLRIAQDLIDVSDADALVLGCTELPLAIKPGDIDTVLLDTAQIHIEAIIREILS